MAGTSEKNEGRASSSGCYFLTVHHERICAFSAVCRMKISFSCECHLYFGTHLRVLESGS